MESELEPYRATFQGTLLANSLESMNSSISSAISYTVHQTVGWIRVISSSPSLGDCTRSQQHQDPVRVAHGGNRYRPVRRRLGNSPGRSTKPQIGELLQSRLDVDEERELK